MLGASVPTNALVQQAMKWMPEVVGLSAALPLHLPKLKYAVDQLRRAMGPATPKILLGGLAVNQAPGIAKALGVECFCPEARKAVAAVA